MRDHLLRWLRATCALDPRALAAMRALLAIVLLLDIRRAWQLADDWLLLQAYDGWPLPVGFADPTLNLRLCLLLFAAASLAFGLGWQTRRAAGVVWLAACGYAYASRYTIDYHDSALCQLLLWSLVLPLHLRASLDARAGRVGSTLPSWLQTGAAAGLVATVGWIYLSTVLAKSGDGWWSGDAVRWAVADRAVRTGLGTWSLDVLPEIVFRLLTWGTLIVEAAIPLLLLTGRPAARRWACGLLVALHAGMALLMNLGSFPLTMIAAAAGLWLPRDYRPAEASAAATAPPQRVGRVARVLAVLLVANVLLTFDAARQQYTDVDRQAPVNRWLRRGQHLLGTEPVWGMYAPEPWRFTGWWVAVADTPKGWLDPISGRPPTRVSPDGSLAPPDASTLRWAYLWNAPSAPDDEMQGVEDAYLSFLLRRHAEREGLSWRSLALVYVYEPFVGDDRTPRPLLVRRWPADLDVGRVERALGTALYRGEPDRFGDPDWKPHPVR